MPSTTGNLRSLRGSDLPVMTDIMSPAACSTRMSLIRAKNTAPELPVRRALHRHGYRFRLHASNLPGKPDIIFPARRKAIFVHGCFWHQHPGCSVAHVPASRRDYWAAKFKRTVDETRGVFWPYWFWAGRRWSCESARYVIRRRSRNS
jgi:DNA mismatch endonuclease Vsr